MLEETTNFEASAWSLTLTQVDMRLLNVRQDLVPGGGMNTWPRLLLLPLEELKGSLGRTANRSNTQGTDLSFFKVWSMWRQSGVDDLCNWKH